MSDPIVPNHYAEPITGTMLGVFLRHMPYHLGKAIGYIWRAGKKNPETELEDLMKAKQSLDLHIELLHEQKSASNYDKDTREVAEFLTGSQRETISRAAELTDIHLGDGE